MQLGSRPAFDWFLRAAVAFAFLYPPLAALSDPYSWIGYFPRFLSDLAGGNELLLLHAFGAFEAVLALLILVMRRPWLPAAIAAAILVAIVAASPSQFPILFRDLALALSAAALASLHYRRAA